MKSLPNLNPFLGLLADAVTLLDLAAEHEGNQPMACLYSRSSTYHSVAALHAAINALLYFEEQPVPHNDGSAGRESCAEKLDRLFSLRGLAPLPGHEVEILEELERVELVLSDPWPASARPYQGDLQGRRIEFQRTPLKHFNEEALGWLPEYGGCVLALVIRFLNRLLHQHLKLDAAMIEITLGHHVRGEDMYNAVFDTTRLEQLTQALLRLYKREPLLLRLGSPRWGVPPGFFEIQFLKVPHPAA